MFRGKEMQKMLFCFSLGSHVAAWEGRWVGKWGRCRPLHRPHFPTESEAGSHWTSETSRFSVLAKLAVTNLTVLLECERKFLQSPSIFSQAIENAFCGLFTKDVWDDFSGSRKHSFWFCWKTATALCLTNTRKILPLQWIKTDPKGWVKTSHKSMWLIPS